MGLNWFKRVYVTQSSWENQQNITFDGNQKFDVRGRKGPRAERFDFKLVINNSTRTNVDLGALGGPTKATAEIRGDTLITYIHEIPSNKLFLTASRTVDRRNRNKMTYVTRHL